MLFSSSTLREHTPVHARKTPPVGSAKRIRDLLKNRRRQKKWRACEPWFVSTLELTIFYKNRPLVQTYFFLVPLPVRPGAVEWNPESDTVWSGPARLHTARPLAGLYLQRIRMRRAMHPPAKAWASGRQSGTCQGTPCLRMHPPAKAWASGRGAASRRRQDCCAPEGCSSRIRRSFNSASKRGGLKFLAAWRSRVHSPWKSNAVSMNTRAVWLS